MKLLHTLRTAAPITLVIAMAIAPVPTAASAQSDAEPPKTADQERQEWLARPEVQEARKELLAAMAARDAAADAALDVDMLDRAMAQAMKDYSEGEFAKALPVFLKLHSGTGYNATASQFLLGQMHQSGYGVAKNEAEAIRYYTLAAAGDWPDANYNLGNIYYTGSKNADAFREFRTFVNYPEANAEEKIEARYKLGMLYKNGTGVAQDYALAAKEFAISANEGAGHNKARYELGMLYLKGDGVGQDDTSAASYLQKASVYNEAAEQSGEIEAQFALSKLYSMGKGVAQSDAKAVEYLRMAARDDHTKAQFGLGVMYMMGKGVPQEMSIGYLWIARAAEGDQFFQKFTPEYKAMVAKTHETAEAIQARDAIRSRLTPEQIAQGKVLVDRCIASSYACNWGE